MGWLHDAAPDHEGFVVGLRKGKDDWRFIELGFGDEPQAPFLVQVGCDCGWRSSYLRAPFGARFFPSIVETPANFDDFARTLWHEHILAERQRPAHHWVFP